MARIGARYPKYCKVTVTQNPDGSENESLSVGAVAGKAIGVNTTISADAVMQYADDGIAETAAEFTSGTIALELNDTIDGVEADLLGSEITEDGVFISHGDDNAPYVRFGYVEAHLLNNVKDFRVVVYPRVKFAPPNTEATTKGQTITFGSATLNGTVMRDKDGAWRLRKTFSTQLDAVAFLNSQVNIGGTIPTFSQTSVPANGATGASKTDPIVITFTNVVDHGNATLVNAGTNAVVSATKAFDGTKKVLTITPAAALDATTEYLVVLDVTDAYAQNLSAVISFTTEA
nr:MAG TPA: tail tube protein [Caudoviricetes sp.]